MFGYTREELIGLHVTVLAAPESLPILDDVLKTLKAGRGVQTVVAQGLRKDGTAFYVESHSTTTIYTGKPHTLRRLTGIKYTEGKRCDKLRA